MIKIWGNSIVATIEQVLKDIKLAVWVGAMLGYDKVIQMLEQLKTLKLK